MNRLDTVWYTLFMAAILLVWFWFLWSRVRGSHLWLQSGIVLLTAIAFSQLPVWLARWFPLLGGLNHSLPFLSLTLLIVGAGIGGWIVLRMKPSSWPDPFWTATTAASAWALGRMVLAFPVYWGGGVSSFWLVRAYFLDLVLFSAGGFMVLLMPWGMLKNRPPMRTGRMMIAAGTVAGMLLGAEFLFLQSLSGGTLGLVMLVVGGFLSLAGVAVGMILTAAHRNIPGTYLGTGGTFLWFLVIILWGLLGAPWFP